MKNNHPACRQSAVSHAFYPLAIILLAASTGFSQDGRYRELRIPSGLGFDFPASEKRLTEIRTEQDTRDMRSHAWAVFAGLVQPAVAGDIDGEAVFETWYSKREMAAGCQRLVYLRLRELTRPIEIVAHFLPEATPPEPNAPPVRLKPEALGLSAAKDLFSDVHSPRGEVLYNFSACSHIRTLNLLDEAALDAQNAKLNAASAPAQERDIPPFPHNAVVVKDVWTVVTPGISDIQLPGATPGDLVSTGIKTVEDGEPCNLPVPQGNPIPTSCFFHIKVTAENIASIRAQEESGMPPVCEDCVLILVGLHVITKEAPDWTWSTFWWSPEPNKAPYGSDRPGLAFIKSPWRNYVMNTTLSMVTPWEPVTGASEIPANAECTIDERGQKDASKAKICFNPYIERMRNGATSNCMNCHKQASHRRPSPDPTRAAQRGYLGSDAACFSSRVRVDYLWSLSPRGDSALFKFDQDLTTALVELLSKNRAITH